MTKLRPAIVLLGMHRSGTSLAMSVLNGLGVQCGDDLIPAGRGNESGFWEHAGIVAVHEHLLADLDRIWDGPKGSYAMPDGWLHSEAAARARDKLVEIVGREVGAVGEQGVWGFKDPRTCRLLPLWHQVFEETRIDPQYVLATRDPVSVSASLQRHNGMRRSRSELLWLQYNLEPLRLCGERLLLVVDYDRLVEQTAEEVHRISRALAHLFQITASEKKKAIARVAPNLRRAAIGESGTASQLVNRARDALKLLAVDVEPGDEFYRFVSDFADFQEIFEPWQADRKHPFFDLAIRLIVRGRYR